MRRAACRGCLRRRLRAAALSVNLTPPPLSSPPSLRTDTSDAASMLLRFGEACDKAGARSSQTKAYLGAVVVWLYAENAQEAWQVGSPGRADQGRGGAATRRGEAATTAGLVWVRAPLGQGGCVSASGRRCPTPLMGLGPHQMSSPPNAPPYHSPSAALRLSSLSLQVYQDVMDVASFASSEEAFSADALFEAYRSGKPEKVKAVVAAKSAFKHMDSQVRRYGTQGGAVTPGMLRAGDVEGQ